MGIAGVAYVRGIEDVDRRAALEITNLKLSKAIMAARNDLSSIGDWQRLVRDFYNAQDL